MNEQRVKPDKEKRWRGWQIALLITVAVLLCAAAIVITLDGRHVRFHVVGSREMTVGYRQVFQDPGCSATSMGKLFGEGKYPLPVTVEGQVDTSQLGRYELTYRANWMLRSYTASRTVIVADLEPPVITLKTRPDYEPSWFTGYEEEGFTALDDHDGDLTDRVTRQVGETEVVYTVADDAGNVTSVTRPLVYTLGKPEITLLGDQEMVVNASMSFSDPGFTARDDQGHDMSAYVSVTGEVIPYEPGEYSLRYSISNRAGEDIAVVRTVTVQPVRNPDTVTPDGKIIYLTFDDGPGPYTDQLLDVLAKYNVKATFFVTCLNSNYENCVGRAYAEGHSIGVHSATHNYYQIYASEQAFFDDFNTAENMIYRQTGQYTNLFRFPGGSSNTVSNFNPGIMSRLTGTMTNMGYRYFDWNVTSGDAGETTQTRTVIANVKAGCSEHRVSVVLQHDIKDFSVDAVEEIILWALNNGYTFLPLDESSPGMHHGVNN